MPLDPRQFLLEPLGGSDPGSENAILCLIQDKVNYPQRAGYLLGEGDPELLDFFGIDSDRVSAQIPNRQAGSEDCDANDRRTDQVEAAVGWRLPPQIRKQ